jgi:alpha-1,2-mannosyltransferase
MPRWDPRGRLNRVEVAAIALLCIVLNAFTSYIFYRSAFRARRMGDAGVYFRSAWAVRAGEDLYKITDNNGWGYTYPPPLAIVMAPFADAPAGSPRPWMMPYEASLAIWLLLQLGFTVVSVHWVAKAIDGSSPDPGDRDWPTGSRRWWQARLHPLLICLVGVGATISRSQVNVMLLLMLAGMMLCLVRQKRFSAGLWLAAAAALKVIPGFLILFGLWRRDTRFLAGFAAGMFLIMGLLPAATVGPQKAIELNRRFLDTMIFARFGEHEDKSKVKLHDAAMDNQAVMAASYNIRHPGAIQRDAQIKPDKLDRALHWGSSLVLCIVSIVAVWRRDRTRGKDERPRTDMLFIGVLMCAMVAISPMSHLHFFALSIPLVAALWTQSKQRGGPTWVFWSLAAAYFAANLLPHVPALVVLKYYGLAGAANLALWGVGVREMMRPAEPRASTSRVAPTTAA